MATIGEVSSLGASAYDMINFSHIANQMTEDQLEKSHTTMDNLYSYKDLHFHSYFGCCLENNSIQSLHSLNSLDNTFGLVNQSISHLIDGIKGMLEKKAMEEKAASLRGSRNINLLNVVSSHLLPMVNTLMLMTDQLGLHIRDVMLEEKVRYKELPVLGATPRGYKETLKTRLTQALNNSSRSREIASSLLERSSETVEQDGHKAFELLKDMLTFDSLDVVYQSLEVVYKSAADTSDICSPGKLFAQIAELESKILNIESQLAQDESIKLSIFVPEMEDSNSKTPLMTNAKSRTMDMRNDTTLLSSALQLIFMEETLVMIKQKQLGCTLLPSKGEVDSTIIQEAKDKALLGKYLDDDLEEESTIYKLPDES